MKTLSNALLYVVFIGLPSVLCGLLIRYLGGPSWAVALSVIYIVIFMIQLAASIYTMYCKTRAIDSLDPAPVIAALESRLSESEILAWVAHEGHCAPDRARLVDIDLVCPVWKVTVKSFNKDAWDVPPPDFFYVCDRPFLRLYGNRDFNPRWWLPWDEQDEGEIIDYMKTFHIGLARRKGF